MIKRGKAIVSSLCALGIFVLSSCSFLEIFQEKDSIFYGKYKEVDSATLQAFALKTDTDDLFMEIVYNSQNVVGEIRTTTKDNTNSLTEGYTFKNSFKRVEENSPYKLELKTLFKDKNNSFTTFTYDDGEFLYYQKEGYTKTKKASGGLVNTLKGLNETVDLEDIDSMLEEEQEGEVFSCVWKMDDSDSLYTKVKLSCKRKESVKEDVKENSITYVWVYDKTSHKCKALSLELRRKYDKISITGSISLKPYDKTVTLPTDLDSYGE